MLNVAYVFSDPDNLAWPDLTRLDLTRPDLTIRAFHFAPCLTFPSFFGVNSMQWDLNSKIMSFFFHKNCFFGLRTRYKILKILEGVKKENFIPVFILGV